MTSSVLTASALGLSRNESGRRFPHAEDAAALEELRSGVIEILTGGSWDQPWHVHDLEKMDAVEVDHLVERGLMTPAFADRTGEGRGFAVYGDGEASLEINGEDHLRLLAYRRGGDLTALWSLLSRLDDGLETVLSYAFDPQWGYLTARPHRAGSGMRAYATLHLPALTLMGRLSETALELAGQRFGLTPLWGGLGGIIQVSNLGPQGKPETEILQQIGHIVRGVIEKERSVRKMPFRENPVQSRDQIGRALGLLQQAWSMPFHESVNLISAVEVGIDAGLVEAPGLGSEPTFGLMSRLQPAHVVVDYMDRRVGCLESPAVDEQRARLLRELFAGAVIMS